MSELSENENDPENGTCPKCGVDLPEGAPNGLCPVCLMAGAMEPTGHMDGTGPEPPAIDDVQAAFPHLEILGIVGVGGMGVVYKARQTSLNRAVALKLLAPHREKEAGFSERFVREAQALAAMNHPNIVTVHDFGQESGFYYLLMEFVDGVNLREAMKAGRFTPEEALAIVPPVCDALQYAHDQGIVHRDIKPENLLLDKVGKVKVADFGIARILNLADTQSNEDSGLPETDETQLTAGTALGTPNYMAPEQAAAPERVDHRADIYSLGVVFYEMLTGERPSGSIGPLASRLSVDVRLDEIVVRALADSPELRYQSATEFRTQVETLAQPAPSETASVSQPGVVWKWLGIVFGVLSVPALVLAAVLLLMVVDDGSWNPSWREGIVTFLIWGSALFFSAATIFSRTMWLGEQPVDHRKGRLRTIGVSLVGLLAVLVFFVLFFDGTREKTEHAAKVEVLKAQAETVRAEMAEALSQREMIENSIETKTDPEARRKAERAAALASDRLVGATRMAAELDRQIVAIANEKRPTLLRLSVGTVLLILFGLCLVAVLLFVARSVRGFAGDCIVAVMVVVGMIALSFLIYLRAGAGFSVAEVGHRANNRVRDRSGPVDFIFRLPGVKLGENSATLHFDFQAPHLPDGWGLWQVTEQRKGSEWHGASSSQLSESKAGTVSFPIEGIELDNPVREEIVERMIRWETRTMTLESGSPQSIFEFTDANGTRVTVDLELRPTGLVTAEPANIVFVREVQLDLDAGRILVALNDVQTVGEYEMFVETRGTAVEVSSTASLESASFADEVSPGMLWYSRRKLVGGGSLKFDFPPMEKMSTKRLPAVGSRIFVLPGTGSTTLFDIVDSATGRRVVAELRLLKAGGYDEFVPGENGTADGIDPKD